MDFTTAGPAQNVWLWPSQDAMKTSREAEHDQDQHIHQDNSNPSVHQALTMKLNYPPP